MLRQQRALLAWANVCRKVGILLGRAEALGRSNDGTLLEASEDLVTDLDDAVQLVEKIFTFDVVLNLDEELERARPDFWVMAMTVHFWAARDMIHLLQSAPSKDNDFKKRRCSLLLRATPLLLSAANALHPSSKHCGRLLHAIMRADTLPCYSAILGNIRQLQHVMPSELGWMLSMVLVMIKLVSHTFRCINANAINDSKDVKFKPALYREWMGRLAECHLLEHAAGAILRIQEAARLVLASGGNMSVPNTREGLNNLRGYFGRIIHRTIEPFLGQSMSSLCPRPLTHANGGANLELRDMLPMIRNLMSGTCLQYWLGRELILLRLAVSNGVGPTHGLRTASFLPPQLLAPPVSQDGPIDGTELGFLLKHMNVCTIVWQLTVSGPYMAAPVPPSFSNGLLPDPPVEVTWAPTLPYNATHVYELSHEALWCVARRAAEIASTSSSSFTEIANSARMLVRLISELRPRAARPRVPGLWRTMFRILEEMPLLNTTLLNGFLRSLCSLIQMNEPAAERVQGERAAQREDSENVAIAGGSNALFERGLAVGLHGALVAGFLPSLESALRRAARGPITAGGPAALNMLNVMLRGSGVWAAILAHGSLREVLSLVITLRKITQVFVAHGPLDVLSSLIALHMLMPGDPSTALIDWWTASLGAMIEQVMAVMLPPPPAAAGAAATDGGGAARAGDSRNNRTRGGGRTAASGSESGSTRQSLGDPLLPLNSALEFSFAEHISLEWLEYVGGRPVRGSAGAAQQRLLTVFVLTQWLPAVMRFAPSGRLWENKMKLAVAKLVLIAAMQCLKARRRYALSERTGGGGDSFSSVSGIADTDGGDNQAAAAGGEQAASEADQSPDIEDLGDFLSWRTFLNSAVGVIPWLNAVVGSSLGIAAASLRAEDKALVCCALDVLEVLVLTTPEDVRDRVKVASPRAAGPPAGGSRARGNKKKDNGKAAASSAEGAAEADAGDGGGSVATLSEELLLAHGRGALLRALQALRPIPVVDLSPGRPSSSPSSSAVSGSSGSATGSSPFAGGRLSLTPEVERHVGALWLEASTRLNPDAVPDLPSPMKALRAAAAVGVRPCSNPSCRNLLLGQEAALKPKRCSRCKAVWYCCSECQLEHWGAGHKATCLSSPE